MSDDREKILNKIRGLAALANPENNPFENEVATASAMMQKLMDQYNMSLAEVMLTETERTVDHFVSVSTKNILGRLKAWHWGLGRVIGRITGTKNFGTGAFGASTRDAKRNVHGHRMTFFGTSGSAQLAADLFDEWVITIDKMASKEVSMYIELLEVEYAEEMVYMEVKQVRHLQLGHKHPNIWRDSWLEGVISGISHSLSEQENSRDAQTSTALAVISKELAIAYRELAGGFKSVTTHSAGNSSAYNRGYNTGQNLSLTSKKLKG